MRFRVSIYLAAVMAALAAFVLSQSLPVGLAFLFASAATYVPLRILPVPTRFFYIQLFIAITLLVTTLARVPFLAAEPDVFLYHRIGVVTPEILAVVLVKFAFYAALLFLGLFLGFRLFARNPNVGARQGAPLFLRASVVIALVSLLIFSARAFLQLGLGLHTKSVVNPRFGFLSELVPDGFLYPICILFIAKYRKLVPPFEAAVFGAIVAGMIGLTVISGSRRSIAALGLALFIYFLSQRGDFRISLGRGFALASLGLSLLLLSFAVAGTVRSTLRGQGGYSADFGKVIWRGAKTAFHPDAAIILGHAVSRRVSLGMDGLVAVEMYRPKLAVERFSPRSALQRAAAKLIPRYRAPGNEMSSGKILGVAYDLQALDLRHASAFGLFASLNLTFGRWLSFVAAFTFGLLCAAYFSITARIREPDVVYLLHFIGMQFTFAWIISGNFDGLVAATISNFVVLSTYSFGIVMMIAAAGRRWEPEPRVGLAQSARGVEA